VTRVIDGDLGVLCVIAGSNLEVAGVGMVGSVSRVPGDSVGKPWTTKTFADAVTPGGRIVGIGAVWRFELR
jgi:hypothetical protein